ncbi:hypothetical protein C8R46DRAFT_517467 [Mycena filopes]|nr:hypothetical protein C8R46DRAFT_517467 [Mycena filopes]
MVRREGSVGVDASRSLRAHLRRRGGLWYRSKKGSRRLPGGFGASQWRAVVDVHARPTSPSNQHPTPPPTAPTTDSSGSAAQRPADSSPSPPSPDYRSSSPVSSPHSHSTRSPPRAPRGPVGNQTHSWQDSSAPPRSPHAPAPVPLPNSGASPRMGTGNDRRKTRRGAAVLSATPQTRTRSTSC